MTLINIIDESWMNDEFKTLKQILRYYSDIILNFYTGWPVTVEIYRMLMHAEVYRRFMIMLWSWKCLDFITLIVRKCILYCKKLICFIAALFRI